VLKAPNREKLAHYEMFRRCQFCYNYLCVPKYVRIVPHVVNKKGRHVIRLKATKNIKLNFIVKYRLLISLFMIHSTVLSVYATFKKNC